MWLLEKVERIIDLWCNKWLSQGGRLVLAKSVFELISVYLHNLAFIPKGVLEKVQKCCFNFLWQGSSEYKGTHWVSWKKVALPKSLGGWGLKDIFSFGRSLAAKPLWNFISKYSLWKQILAQKNISLNTINDWIKREPKHIQNVSNQWKALSLAFALVGVFLAWKVSNGTTVRIRKDAIIDCNQDISLPEGLAQHL